MTAPTRSRSIERTMVTTLEDTRKAQQAMQENSERLMKVFQSQLEAIQQQVGQLKSELALERSQHNNEKEVSKRQICELTTSNQALSTTLVQSQKQVDDLLALTKKQATEIQASKSQIQGLSASVSSLAQQISSVASSAYNPSRNLNSVD